MQVNSGIERVMFGKSRLLLQTRKPKFTMPYAFRIIQRNNFYRSGLFYFLSDPATIKYPVDVVTFPKEYTVWRALISLTAFTEATRKTEQHN